MANSELKWQPRATAPRDGDPVFVLMGCNMIVMAEWDQSGWVESLSKTPLVIFFDNDHFTVWAPLPDIPSDKEIFQINGLG